MDDEEARDAAAPHAAPASAAEPVTVHASLRGLTAAIITPVALLSLGLGALASGGPRILPLLLASGGAILGAIVVLDVPRRAVFDAQGVTRVCFARHHRIPWGRIVAIERGRPNTAATLRNLSEKGDERVVSGGLIARGTGRRRWLLTDQVESRLEYDRLSEVVETPSVPSVLRAPRPHDAAPPTFLYRRRAND